MQNLQNDHSQINSLIGRLLHYAQTTPLHDAIVTPNLTLSYGQLADYVITQTAALKEIGVSAESSVGILCTDDAQHLVLTLATCYIGATSSTIPSYETAEVREAISQKCHVTHILDGSVAIDLTIPIEKLTNNEKPAVESCMLFSTSGSTGTPKLIIHHDNDLVEQAHRHINSAQERFTCLASMEHNFAKRHRLYCLAIGASNIFLSGKMNTVVKECLALRTNVMHVSSFQAQELLNQVNIHQLAHIRLKLGGSHVPLALRHALRANITSALQAGYGTTETGAIAFTDTGDLESGESVGKALPGIALRCVDTERNPVKQGERGEVAIRCKGLFRGYYKRAELTDEHLENDWFYTGDIAYLDAQNRIHLCGRSDDMFTFNSMNIYPQEIESVIRQFPDVIDAIVLPKPSVTHGSIPVAIVAFNPTMKPRLAVIKAFIEKQVGIRSPRQYIFVDKIPANASGKISRIDASALSEKSDEIRKTLIGLLDKQSTNNVRVSEVQDFIDGKRDLSFRKLDMDSLARMNLLVALEVNYDIVVSPQELTRLRTLGKLASRIITCSGMPTPIQQDMVFENIKSSDKPQPFIARFFQRICHYCTTVAQLNNTFAKLEHRLTPLDIAYVDQAHSSRKIIMPHANEKFEIALSAWINDTKQLMLNSQKKIPEHFVLRRITPHINLFSSGSQGEKTLLISFPPRGVRHLTIPTAVVLQHIDATQYDLLMVSPENGGGYAFGTIPFGRKLLQQATWLKQQAWFQSYKRIRTFGLSAGSFPAIALGYLLHAELALSIAGRFHRKKRFLVNIDKKMTIRQLLKRSQCDNVLLSYSQYNKRDQRFANYFAKACNGKEVAIEIKTERLPHLLLRRLAERGELAPYFSQTLLARPENLISNNKHKKSTIYFPVQSQL